MGTFFPYVPYAYDIRAKWGPFYSFQAEQDELELGYRPARALRRSERFGPNLDLTPYWNYV